MSRFDERLQQDLGHIADRATPSDTAWDAIRTRIAEQAPIADTEIIMLDKNPDPQRRSRTSAWLLSAAAAAVLIVGVAVALSRSGDEPAAVFAGDESTESVEESPGVDPLDDTETPALVQAPNLTVTFDGENCLYEGPDEFDAGSEVTFTLVDASGTRSVGIGVWKLAPGTTAEEILDRGIFNRGAQIAESAPAELTDSGIRVTYLLTDAGPYAINCAHRPDGGTAVDYATLFTVGE